MCIRDRSPPIQTSVVLTQMLAHHLVATNAPFTDHLSHPNDLVKFRLPFLPSISCPCQRPMTDWGRGCAWCAQCHLWWELPSSLLSHVPHYCHLAALSDFSWAVGGALPIAGGQFLPLNRKVSEVYPILLLQVFLRSEGPNKHTSSNPII